MCFPKDCERAWFEKVSEAGFRFEQNRLAVHHGLTTVSRQKMKKNQTKSKKDRFFRIVQNKFGIHLSGVVSYEDFIFLALVKNRHFRERTTQTKNGQK